MATTTPETFTGPVTLTADHVHTIREAYESNLRDEDKAGDPDTAAFYEGQRSAYQHVLRMIHDKTALHARFGRAGQTIVSTVVCGDHTDQWPTDPDAIGITDLYGSTAYASDGTHLACVVCGATTY